MEVESASMWFEKVQLPCFHIVSRCCTRGESEDHTGKKADKQEIHPGFEI